MGSSQSGLDPFFATRRLVAYSLAGTEGCLSRQSVVDLSADFQR